MLQPFTPLRDVNDYVPDRVLLDALLGEAADRHKHLCPRIVLGVRIGLYALRTLGLADEQALPRYDNGRKRLFTFVEIDGCGADGICTATDCWVVRRTLHVVDYGKMAATVYHRPTQRAVRIAPAAAARDLAPQYAPDARSRWHAYLEAYQVIPDRLLLTAQAVALGDTVERLISRPGVRVDCAHCGEEIVNEREVRIGDSLLCSACADGAYYIPQS